jgi:hypothetical protein
VFNVCLIFEGRAILISDISRGFLQLTEDNYFSRYLIPDLEYRNGGLMVLFTQRLKLPRFLPYSMAGPFVPAYH